jgi:hypothetical protein
MTVASGSKKIIREHLEDISYLVAPANIEGAYTVDDIIPDDEKGSMSYARYLAWKLYFQACTGSDKAMREILDRLLGKPAQFQETIQHTMTYTSFLDDCVARDAEFEQIPPPDDDIVNELLG